MAAQDGEGQRLLGDEGVRENRPIFPLDKETMTEFMQQVSAAALVGICTGIVLPLQGLTDDEAPKAKLFRVIYYLFLPIGLVGLVVTISAKRVERLIGVAAGFLLFEFCLIPVIGCIAAVIEFGGAAWPAMVVAAFLLALTVFGWVYCCSYPKCICRAVGQPSARTIIHAGEIHKCSICSTVTNADGVPLQVAVQGEDRCPGCLAARAGV